jgi:hypothetical protein
MWPGRIGESIARSPHRGADFEQLYGDRYRHAAQWVTGLTAEQLIEQGGVVFSGAIDVTWPA